MLARNQFYFPVFLLLFACNKACLDWLAFGCDAWSRSLGCGYEHYPGFGLMMTSVGLRFAALSVKE
jgi:hypothetical protein